MFSITNRNGIRSDVSGARPIFTESWRFTAAFIAPALMACLIIVVSALLGASNAIAQQYCAASFPSNANGWFEAFWGNGSNVVAWPGGAPGPTSDEIVARVAARNAYNWCLPGDTNCSQTLTGACDPTGAVTWSIHLVGVTGNVYGGIATEPCQYGPVCPAGYTPNSGNCTLVEPAVQSCLTQQKPSKTRGKPVMGGCQEGNPCDVATGNKFQREVDDPATTLDGLSYIRYYNSDIYTPSNRFPSGWRDEFDRQLLFTELSPIAKVFPASGTREALVYRPDGKIITFTMNGSIATATDPDTVETLTQVNS